VTGFLVDPAVVYQLLDVVALPTYREGYPTVALEAAAACRPFVTTSATGAVEAVEHGVTGLLAPPGDSRALAAAVASLLDDPKWAAEMASRARRRVVKEFSQQRIWQEIVSVYRDLLRENPRHGAAAAVGSAAVGSAAVGSAPASTGWALSPGKRAFDVVLALLGLVVGGPLLLAAATAIAAAMGRPILFRQPRLGLRGRSFEMFKLRTMAEARGSETVPEAERLTPAGRLLRRWSLDELPQLWNVLRGEMSLVGPRPLPPEYSGRYSPRQRSRHGVKPGLTGWAQAMGRNAINWQERFELDLWYVEHASLGLDLRILARSFRVVLSGAGVGPPGAALMPEFLGDQHDPA
jgi:lipopolysaccharide/colanic/teichoic acid biosynthesis glycosyltransferase